MASMPRSFVSAAKAAVLVAALAAASACSGTNAVSQDVSGSNGYVTGDNSLEWVAPAQRKPVDDVSGKLLDGSAFDLREWRGKGVVVNFWGSWCQPCRSEAKALDAVYRATRSRGVEFLGVDVRENPVKAETFVRTPHIGSPSLSDESSLLALRFPGLPPNATPTTIVLDRRGRIAARHSGEILYTQLSTLVTRVAA